MYDTGGGPPETSSSSPGQAAGGSAEGAARRQWHPASVPAHRPQRTQDSTTPNC